MKKIKLKGKTIFWLILTIISLIILIISSIWIHNIKIVFEASKYVELTSLNNRAKLERGYAIAFIFLSSIVILMGSYISYAGIKSWKYEAIE